MSDHGPYSDLGFIDTTGLRMDATASRRLVLLSPESNGLVVLMARVLCTPDDICTAFSAALQVYLVGGMKISTDMRFYLPSY